MMWQTVNYYKRNYLCCKFTKKTLFFIYYLLVFIVEPEKLRILIRETNLKRLKESDIIVLVKNRNDFDTTWLDSIFSYE